MNQPLTPLEAKVASVCPDLTRPQISNVCAAMTEAKQISPKNPAAGYGMTLLALFPDPAVKKAIFTKTKRLLPHA